MFLPIQTQDWFCPAGHRRELLGELGERRLRCRLCEGYSGPFTGTSIRLSGIIPCARNVELTAAKEPPYALSLA